MLAAAVPQQRRACQTPSTWAAVGLHASPAGELHAVPRVAGFAGIASGGCGEGLRGPSCLLGVAGSVKIPRGCRRCKGPQLYKGPRGCKVFMDSACFMGGMTAAGTSSLQPPRRPQSSARCCRCLHHVIRLCWGCQHGRGSAAITETKVLNNRALVRCASLDTRPVWPSVAARAWTAHLAVI
jgi:hypothetical protein